jgi:hypothetical protein
MLQAFGTEIWTADGPNMAGDGGFHFPTRMMVIGLAGFSYGRPLYSAKNCAKPWTP